MKTTAGLFGRTLDEIQMEAIAGVALLSECRTRIEVKRQAERTSGEIVRLLGQGRRYLRVIEGGKREATCGCNPQAA